MCGGKYKAPKGGNVLYLQVDTGLIHYRVMAGHASVGQVIVLLAFFGCRIFALSTNIEFIHEVLVEV